MSWDVEIPVGAVGFRLRDFIFRGVSLNVISLIIDVLDLLGKWY